MRGSPVYQVHELFLKSGINKIGASKHAAKAAARESITASGSRGSRSANWHNIGKNLGIHSFATADAYRDVWRHALVYAREKFRIRSIEKLTPEAIQSFLESKVTENVSHATFMQYAAALEKLETALNMYAEKFHGKSNKYDFSSAISSARQEAHTTLARFTGSRAYQNPEKIIDNINGTSKLVARLQYEAGLRIKETNKIRSDQLLGNNTLEVRGGKGGKIREVQLKPDLYAELREKIDNSPDHTFSYNQNIYRHELKTAVEAAGEQYTGKATHGLRWSYAQQHYQEVARETESTTAALYSTSEALGHDRADITAHYLK